MVSVDKKATQREERNIYLQTIMSKTGWNRQTAEERFLEANKRTGCTLKEYKLYRFYELNKSEQEAVLLEAFSTELRRRYDVKEVINLLINKEKTNKFFADYIKRPWCVNTKVNYIDFCKIFSNSRRIIYKPLKGHKGQGIEAFNLDKKILRNVFNTLCTYPDGVVEEFVDQHPDLKCLMPDSVNTIRIVSISSNTVPVLETGEKVDIAYASLRIGGGTAVVDNFHSGGMVANIDLNTGEIITDAANLEGDVYSAHPVTNIVFKGFQIPYFQEAIEMVKQAITEKSIEGYLGWDVAISTSGPVLIEVNAMPGVVLLSTPYAAEHKGMKYVMERYMYPLSPDAEPKVSSKEIKEEPPNGNIVFAKQAKPEKEICILETIKATGWDREEATEKIELARERLTASYQEYRIWGLYKFSSEILRKAYNRRVAALVYFYERKHLKDYVVRMNYIKRSTDWDYDEIELHLADAKARTGCTLKEYQAYRFYEIDNATQESYCLKTTGAKLTKKYSGPEIVSLLNDKEATNTKFNEYLKRAWCVNTKITLEQFRNIFKGCNRIIFKPINRISGLGIKDFYITSENIDETYQNLTILPEGVIEDFVIQHDDMMRLCPTSVNTIRIVSISSNTEPVTQDGKYQDIAYASVRIGGGTACVDNFHAGGVCAAVDLNTGTILTDGVDMYGNVYEKHPFTDIKIKGYQLPDFRQVTSFIYEIINKYHLAGYLGWDICMTSDGPVLIEINTSPGPDVLQGPYAPEHKGMKGILTKYL